MNKVHCVIWSESLGAYVVAHEHAKAHGRLSTTRKALATAVALGIGSLLAPYAWADSCPASGMNTLTSSFNSLCSLAAGDSLTVQAPNGEIDNNTGTAVLINYGGAGSNTIINNNLISGSTAGISIFNGTKVTGTIVNNSGALITDDEGLAIGIGENSLLSAGITNAGTISSQSSAAISLTHSTLTGGLTNSGLISGGNQGLVASASTINGGITNSGTITGNNQSIEATDSTITGGITNLASGSIELQNSRGVGISLNNSLLTGGINNAGTIAYGTETGTGILVNQGSLSGGIVNSGTITGGGSAGFGIKVTQAHISGNISNSGSIAGSDNDAVELVASTLSGSLLNLAGGTLEGDEHGLNIDSTVITGDVINNGFIHGGELGLRIANGSAISGKLLNGGTISGGSKGLLVSHGTIAGGFTNTGSISGESKAVSISQSSIAGGVTNTGVIHGPSALSINNSDIGSILNTGSITGDSGALVVEQSRVTGSINNQGLIEITQTNGPSAGIFIDSTSTISAGITNSGTIVGGNNGLVIRSSIISGGGLTNVGTISAQGTALSIAQGANVTGDLRNSGTIQVIEGNSSVNAIGLGGLTLTGNVINTGRLLATVNGATSTAQAYGLAVYSNSSVSGGITNTGTISVSATGGSQNQAYGIQVSSSTISGSISNSGLISATVGASGGADKAYGIQIDGSDTSSTVSGGIVNFQQGTIRAQGVGTLAGIDIISSTVDGGLTNSGLITAIGTGTGAEGITAAAVAIGNSGTLSGGLTNTGKLVTSIDNGTGVGQAYGLQISAGGTLAGGISNSGTISATVLGNGLAVGLFVPGGDIDGDIVNYSTGTISASVGLGEAIAIGLSGPLEGSITNNGLITASTVGVLLGNGLITGYITNHSVIKGALGTGISVNSSSVRGGISNTGSITGGNAGISMSHGTIGAGGLSIFIPIATGGITNSGGLISGGAVGILANQSEIHGNVSNSGAITGGATGIHLTGGSTLTGTLNNSGLISGASGAGFLLDGDSTVSGIINSGTIAGTTAAISVTGANTQLDTIDITGNNTARFIGDVIAAGATATVDSGATYTMDNGQHFVVDTFVNSGITGVAASATTGTGTATITGDYAQDSSATLRTYVSNDTNFGHLVVTGTANLPTDAKINVDVSNPGFRFTASELDDVISAGTLNSDGTFDVTTNSLLFNFGAVLDGNTVDLVLTANPTALEDAVAANGRNRAAGGAARVLDNAIFNDPNSTLGTYFGTATTQKALSNAVSQTLPLMSGATVFAAQSALTSMTDIVQSRIESNNGLSSGDGFYGDSHLWMKPFGSWSNQDGRSGSAGYDANTYGAAFGIDGVVSEASRIGLSFAYAKVDTNSDSSVARQSAKVDVYQLMGYGSYAIAPDTEFNYHLGVGRNRTDGERLITLGDTPTKANSNYDSTTATAGVGLGKVFTLDPTTRFIPSVRADYTWIKDDSYHEKGASTIDPLLLSVHKNTTDQFILGVDGKVTHEIVPGTTLEGNLGVGYDVINDGAAINSSFAGAPGQTFTTKGVDPSPWLARGGLGIGTQVGNGVEISVHYDGEVRSDYTNQTASIKLRIPF